MRRRIFVTHTLTVLAALIALLVMSGVVIHVENGRFQERMRSMEAGQIERAQVLLSDYAPSRDWAALDEALKELGYNLHVYITINGRVSYSSLERFQQRMFREYFADSAWPEGSVLTVQNEGAVATGCQSGPYSIVAMRRADGPKVFGDQRPRGEIQLLTLFFSGLVAIVVIVLLSLFSTSHQIKQVMRPVNALTQAARRVEEGDYSQPVGYAGEDEFTAVCAAFDQMQAHLLSEREKSEAYEKARTDLVAGISHDLRTPLTSVKGYLKGLRDGVANTPEKRSQYLEIAYRRACDMDVLLQKLFYFSKLETGSLPLFPERTDLGDFVTRYARDAEEEAAHQGGRFQVKVGAGTHPVRLDDEQARRVLENLTANALRYAKAEPLVLTLTVWRERDRERLRFADNGVGVSEEALPHLFEQFWRGDEARRSKGGEGSGLGLYIVKYIVEAHGGTVWAHNDGGLAFEIDLPRDEEALP